MKRLLIIAGVLAALGFLVWWMTPTQVVKRSTSKLLSAMTLEEGSGDASRNMNRLRLEALIADEIALETPTIEEANGDYERSQISSGFLAMSRAVFTKFELVELHSVEVSGETAKVRAKIEGVVAFSSYRPADGLYEVELDWILEEDNWRLARAKWTEGR